MPNRNPMNRRFLSVLAFSLAVSTGASVLVYNLALGHVAQASTRKRPLNRLLVAARDLNSGALITGDDLKYIETADPVPGQILLDKAQVVNRGVVSPIYAGEPINASRLAPSGTGAGLATLIPWGKRAVALRVDDVVGLAGFVLPGMHVDVIVSGDGLSEQNRSGTLSRTVLQNIEVLSAGQKIEKRPDGKPEQANVVNLLVTPAQAEQLTLASSLSKVQLVLRNPMDRNEEKTPGTSVAALFGLPVPREPAPPPVQVAPVRTPKPKPERPLETLEVFSGSTRTEQKLDSK